MINIWNTHLVVKLCHICIVEEESAGSPESGQILMLLSCSATSDSSPCSALQFHWAWGRRLWTLELNHTVSPRDLRKSDANGFVQRAITAANVYNNIVKYVDDANITSLTTFNLSERAEDVCQIMQFLGIHLLHSTFYQSLLFFFIHLSFRPPVGSMRSLNTS